MTTTREANAMRNGSLVRTASGWLGRFLRRFLGSKAGNIAMIYGLAAIPVLTAAGSAIDMSRALVVRSRLAQ
ncbi:MAG: hypothetical protein GC199_03155, partial [Alphaproteobacteria bacterium]|nr:hypothetical protein [Alphaproteobacteria bacterium]